MLSFASVRSNVNLSGAIYRVTLLHMDIFSWIYLDLTGSHGRISCWSGFKTN
jgi:hypothetical protein